MDWKDPKAGAQDTGADGSRSSRTRGGKAQELPK